MILRDCLWETFLLVCISMDIYWYGQACFRLKGKNATLVIDPFDPQFVGLKLPKDVAGDIILVTHGHQDHNNSTGVGGVSGTPMVFDKPGEYEANGVVITAVSSYHDNSQGSERGTNIIFHIMIDGLNIVHLGDLGQNVLTEEQVAQIGEVDILLIPVGSVYTINSKAASDIVSQLEPKIIIPMHYRLEGLKFELEPVDIFLKEMGAENTVAAAKLSMTKDKLPEEPMVVVLGN